jgi:hypothetical protein
MKALARGTSVAAAVVVAVTAAVSPQQPDPLQHPDADANSSS